MIEIRKLGDTGRYQFIVNDYIVSHASILDSFEVGSVAGDFLNCLIYDEEATSKIAAHLFSDLPKEIIRLELRTNYSLLEVPNIFQGVTVYAVGSGQFEIALDFYIDSANWKQLWSAKEYQEELIRLAEKDKVVDIRIQDPEMDEYDDDFKIGVDFSIRWHVEDSETTIEKEILKPLRYIQELHQKTLTSLMTNLRNESVVMYFGFPEEVRVSCEQYLLYFVQFLKDLGVEATAELQHEAGQVLFAITPSDKDQALDKIRDALEVYLQLPASKLAGEDRDIVTQRLAANVYHLKSQLVLAQAMLQTKNATIQAQQLTIDIQRGLLSGEIIIDSLKNVTPKPEDKENLLGGVLALATYKDKGIEVNLAELYRKLRRLFKDKEDKQ